MRTCGRRVGYQLYSVCQVHAHEALYLEHWKTRVYNCNRCESKLKIVRQVIGGAFPTGTWFARKATSNTLPGTLLHIPHDTAPNAL
jgi:hypothetical protein